ncbi:MAG: hypothetical protein ACI9G1_002750 [Pirellulaceae bacterium]|jgi:hypothetical protein
MYYIPLPATIRGISGWEQFKEAFQDERKGKGSKANFAVT